jgi:hypothetical protein
MRAIDVNGFGAHLTGEDDPRFSFGFRNDGQLHGLHRSGARQTMDISAGDGFTWRRQLLAQEGTR